MTIAVDWDLKQQNKQVAIGFLKSSGTDPPCFSREVRTALCVICWCLKNVIRSNSGFFGSAHVCAVMINMMYSGTSMARTGFGPWKIVLAKGSSSHPGWLCIKWPVGTVMIVLASPGEWAIRVWAIEVLLYVLLVEVVTYFVYYRWKISAMIATWMWIETSLKAQNTRKNIAVNWIRNLYVIQELRISFRDKLYLHNLIIPNCVFAKDVAYFYIFFTSCSWW